MTVALKALLGARRAGHVGGTDTVIAMWGRAGAFNMGVGWKPKQPGNLPSPVGILAADAQQVAYGYSGGISVLANGHTEIWGQNVGGAWPSSVGPEVPWVGKWGYRTGLAAQKTLEGEGYSADEIRTKERALAVPTRTDGRKALPGQLAYQAGQCVIDEGHAYIALEENVAKKPSLYPEAWGRAKPDVALTERESKSGATTWVPRRGNLTAPIRSPQLKNVKAASAAGGHMLALLNDGTLRMCGHLLERGAGGADYNSSYGPPKRPLLPPPTRINEFQGTLTAGSKIVTGLSGIQIKHTKTPSFTASFGQATKVGSAVFMPSHNTLTIDSKGEANHHVGTAAANVTVTENPGPGAIAVTPISETECALELTGFTPGTSVEIHYQVACLAEGTTLAGHTEEELLDEEGHPFVPAQVKVLTIELSEPALADYTGTIKLQKPAKEAKFWPGSQNITNSATWPAKVLLPGGVTCQAIATGTEGDNTFSLALTTTGEVLAWGSNLQGMMGNGETANDEHFNAKPAYVLNPAGTAHLKDIVAIAAGEASCAALDSTGKIYIWGSADKGLGGKKLDEEATGKSSSTRLLEGVPAGAGEKPVAIALGASTGYMTLENGKVYAWGNNEKGQCANGSSGKANKQWKSGHAYTTGEKVYDRGRNYKCKSNVTSATHPGEDATHWEGEAYPAQPVPAEIVGLANVNYIAAGRAHAAAVTATGDMFTWGSNTEGQIGNGAITETPVTAVHKVDLGERHVLSCALSEYNTVAIIQGTEPAAPNIVKLTLLPAGETSEGELPGEQDAKLRIELDTELPATGWRLRFKRSASSWEKAELAEIIETLLEELEAAEASGTKEEREELEEELEAAEATLESLGGGVETIDPLTFEEVEPGLLRYDWTPPGPLTPNFTYSITSLSRPASPEWQEVWIETEGLFSPYTLG